LSYKELGFHLGFFLNSFGFVGEAPNKLNHAETHIHLLPCKEKLKKKRKKSSGSEGLSPLNFLDFLNMVGHMKTTIFWSKGRG
jgi:hypothetical protein